MSNSRVPGPLGADTSGIRAESGLQVRIASAPPVPVGTNAPATPTPTAAADATDAEIEGLDLEATAKKAAYALKKAHPTVSFTSGRRDTGDQARAMASNVVENRKWIEETYSKTTAREKCQKWVDDNPDAKTQAEIAAGLLGVLDSLTKAQLGSLSKHLSGEAFDVQPVDTDAEAIKTTIRGLAGLGKFLESEGGLVRWHAQF